MQENNSERKNNANKNDINIKVNSSNGKKGQGKDNPLWLKLVVGGVGGLTPIVVSIYLADGKVIGHYLQTLNSGGWVELFGYIIRAFFLFCVGAGYIFLQRKENDLWKIFQLGIVAPSLLMGTVQSNEIKINREMLDSTKPNIEQKINDGSLNFIKPMLGNFISIAYAADYQVGNKSNSEENQLSFWERLKAGVLARPVEDKTKEIVEELEHQNKQNVSLRSELQVLRNQIDDVKSKTILPSECETKWQHKAELLENDVRKLKKTVYHSRLELEKRTKELISEQHKIKKLEMMLRAQESGTIRKQSFSSKLTLFAERCCKSKNLLATNDILFIRLNPSDLEKAQYYYKYVIDLTRKIDFLPGLAKANLDFGTMVLSNFQKDHFLEKNEHLLLRDGEKALLNASMLYGKMRYIIGEATACWNLSQLYKAMDKFILYEKYRRRSLMLIDDALDFIEKLGN